MCAKKWVEVSSVYLPWAKQKVQHMYENKILFYSVCFLLIVVNFFCTGLLTWTTDDKDEERQEPRSHRNFIITDVSLREFTFKSVANARFNCHLIVVT